MSPAAEPLRDEGTRSQVVVAGAIAGLVSRFCIAPLDVLKIRLQLQYHSLADPQATNTPFRKPLGVLQVTRNILYHEGVTGFWKGNIPAEGLYLSYGAAQFLAYRSATQAIDALNTDKNGGKRWPIPGAAKSFVAGAVAGTAATTVTYPLDLLRTRFAAQGTEKVYGGLLSSIRDIKRNEGFGGYFRGLGAGIGQIVPYMGLFFAFYEGLKPALAGVSLPFGSGDAVAGISASVLSKTMVFPLDTVRKRLQVQGPSRHKYVGGHKTPVYDQGVVGTLKMIVRKEGTMGLYRGLSVSLVKAAPASAITMWTYERALDVIKKIREDDE